ncbi:MAG: hypothetical protein U0228_32890 [Myxococcaceae bacterium]
MKVDRLALTIACCLLVALLALSAWVCDDAWITFRTAQRFFEGDGLTWNPGERVQAYTHPLWLFTLLPFTGLTGEFFFTSMVVSAACAVAAVLLLVRSVEVLWVRAALVMLLASSRAFVDFSICGLENPLLALLVVASLLVALREPSARRDVLSSVLLAAVFLVRVDGVLLVGPLWAVGILRRDVRWIPVALALSPVVAWELFSFLYYGSWVPNTAVAKLNLDVSRGVLIGSGLGYLGDSFTRDPISLLTVLIGTGLSFSMGTRVHRALAAGVLLSLVYVVNIGGDFMSGRFVMVPFVASVSLLGALVARGAWPPASPQRLFFVTAAYALLWTHSPLHSASPRFGEGVRDQVELTGVIDERAYYFPDVGLIPVARRLDAVKLVPPYRGACLGRELAQSDRPAQVMGEVGMFGVFAGRKTVIDLFALADPFLARIPYRTEHFRAGHYPRPLPPGYVAARSGTGQLEDEGLRAAFADVELMTRAPLFSSERWAAISRLRSGAHDAAFERASRFERTKIEVPPTRCDDDESGADQGAQ